jgi:hypothetical protein
MESDSTSPPPSPSTHPSSPTSSATSSATVLVPHSRNFSVLDECIFKAKQIKDEEKLQMVSRYNAIWEKHRFQNLERNMITSGRCVEEIAKKMAQGLCEVMICPHQLKKVKGDEEFEAFLYLCQNGYKNEVSFLQLMRNKFRDDFEVELCNCDDGGIRIRWGAVEL